jgi:hypothetical protein
MSSSFMSLESSTDDISAVDDGQSDFEPTSSTYACTADASHFFFNGKSLTRCPSSSILHVQLPQHRPRRKRTSFSHPSVRRFNTSHRTLPSRPVRYISILYVMCLPSFV